MRGKNSGVTAKEASRKSNTWGTDEAVGNIRRRLKEADYKASALEHEKGDAG